MNTQTTKTSSFSQEVKETLSTVFTQVRSKAISAADVWNIQRQKRSRVQRRLAF